jgi:N-(2-amino-2-carboxyethyl)-L-glutamate synthase
MSTDLIGRDRRSTGLSIPIGQTPIVAIRVTVGKRSARLRLKLESFNPCGSIKDRTACSLYDSVASRLDPQVGLIESTSGNLGVALAAIARAEHVPFTAVIDPRTPLAAIAALHRLRAAVVMAAEPDAEGGFLLSRLRIVREALAERPRLVWTNQYENPANPRAHELGTAPELARQVGRRSLVLIPVSTGGTFAGIGAFARLATDWTVIGVDIRGSHALRYVEGRRILPGIGSSRASTFLSRTDWPVRLVESADAVSACLWLSEHSGIGVGGSSGAAIATALDMIRRDGVDDVVCICPDGAERYLDTVYSKTWRDQRHVGVRPFPARVEEVCWHAG